jgi:hypothetical protein
MWIHCLGHFSPLPPSLILSPLPPSVSDRSYSAFITSFLEEKRQALIRKTKRFVELRIAIQKYS